MTVFVVGSVRGSPGVTTTALLLASCVDGVMVEADLDGGVLAVRYGLGREPGLTTLAAAQTVEATAWRQHCQDAGGVPVLVGPDAPERASALWARAGDRLAAALAASDSTVVVDVGRLRPHAATAPLLPAAALAVVLVRPTAEDLVGLSHRLPTLRRAAAEVGVVLVGSGPYTTADIAGELGVAVLGALPEDRRALAMLTRQGGSPRGLSRTRLARAAGSVADAMVQTAGPQRSEPATTATTPEADR